MALSCKTNELKVRLYSTVLLTVVGLSLRQQNKLSTARPKSFEGGSPNSLR